MGMEVLGSQLQRFDVRWVLVQPKAAVKDEGTEGWEITPHLEGVVGQVRMKLHTMPSHYLEIN